MVSRFPSKGPSSQALVGDRYQIEERLGRGGMACVYRVTDCVSLRSLALKQLSLPEDATHKRELAALFEREYHTLAQLSHPRVIEVYDYGLSDLGPYYTMELLDGGDLRERSPIAWRDACALAIDVCSSLALLHSRRLVHRDVSPRNVRCTRSGLAKLIDFGAMAPMGQGDQIVGTPPFVAPEVVLRSRVDGRADLFSLGATLYYALTGHSAFGVREFSELQEAWAQKPPPPSTIVADIPAAFDGLVLSMLSIEPALRPRTVFEVIQRLSAIADIDYVEPSSVSQAYLSTPMMVGRDHALTAARRMIARALNRSGGGLLLHAEEGGGRSRMLDAAVLEGKTLGARVLRASAKLAAHGGVARQLLDQLLESLPDLAVSAARAEGVFADVFESAGATSPEAGQRRDLGPARPRTRRVEHDPAALRAQQSAVPRLLLRVAQRYPLLIAVDDVDQIDDSAVALVASLAHQSERQRLLVIATSRTSAADRSIALEVLRAACQEVALPPLTREQTEELLESVFGDVPNTGLLSERIYALAAGNPRHSMELAQHVIDRGLARYEGGSWTLPSQLDAGDLPVNAEDALRERAGKLSPVARRIAQAQALALPRHSSFERADYVALEPALEGCPLDQAIDELLAQQVITADGRHFSIAHQIWAHALVDGMDPGQLRERHAALAGLYVKDPRRTPVAVHHLLCAEQAEQALDLLMPIVEATEDIGPFVLASRVSAAQMAAILNRAYDEAQRLGRSRRQIAELSRFLIALSIPSDNAHYWRVAPAWLAQVERDAGLVLYRELAHVADPGERLGLALTRVTEQYGATPEADRVYRVDQAIRNLVFYVVVSIAIGTRAQDIKHVRSLPALLAPFVKITPVIEAMWENAVATCESACEFRVESARQRWMSVYERLGKVTGAELRLVEYIRPAIAYGIGLVEARYGLGSAHTWADLLDQDNMQKVNAMYLRRILRLQQGDALGAEQCRRQAELLELQSATRQMFSSTIMAELAAYALAADLTGVKQAADRIAPLAARYPGWRGHAHLAEGQFQLLRGDFPAALAALERCLALVTPDPNDPSRPITAWPGATAAYIETLMALDRFEEARDYGTNAIETCAALGIHFGADEIARVLALAEARLGAHAPAAARLEGVIARQQQAGVNGLPLGATYEARARVAIWAGDQEGITKYAKLSAQEYRHGRGSPLGARYERLMDEARRAGVPILPQLSEFESTAFVTTGFGRQLNVANRVADALNGAKSAEERAQRALAVVCEARGATAGHLYLMGKGGLALAASYRAAPPSALLNDFVRAYFDRELATEEHATGIVMDSAVRSLATASVFTDLNEAVYHPLLMRCQVDGKLVQVGVAALNAVDRPRSPFSGAQLVSAVAAYLVRAGDC